MPKRKAKLLVGTCSWTDPTLVESGWYPERVKDNPEKRLGYYAERFPIVENDASYYALPSQKQAQLWAERTPDEFVMNFKAFATLTTHHTDPKRLPKDVREALSEEAQAKKRVYPKDFPKDAREELFARYWVGLEPLRKAGQSSRLSHSRRPRPVGRRVSDRKPTARPAHDVPAADGDRNDIQESERVRATRDGTTAGRLTSPSPRLRRGLRARPLRCGSRCPTETRPGGRRG